MTPLLFDLRFKNIYNFISAVAKTGVQNQFNAKLTLRTQ